MSATGKTTRILTEPSPNIEIIRRTYTNEEQEKINTLREYSHTLILPKDDPYYPWEAKFLSDNGLAERYMRASKWRLEDAKKRVAATLEWRRGYKPELIPPEEVRIESETGKIILNGFDCNGRPIITMHPGRENTKPSDRQLRHLVYILERSIDLMPPDQDSLVIIVDYRSTTLRSNPSISVASKVLTILQHHYPERLGRAIVVHLPFILQFFYKGISPFLDPVTREKMRFNPDLKELVPNEHLDAEQGGGFEYEFEPVSYWNDLREACHIADDGSRTTGLPIVSAFGTTTAAVDNVTDEPSQTLSTSTDHDDSESDLEPRTPFTPPSGEHEPPVQQHSEDKKRTALVSSEKFRTEEGKGTTEATTILVEPVIVA